MSIKNQNIVYKVIKINIIIYKFINYSLTKYSGSLKSLRKIPANVKNSKKFYWKQIKTFLSNEDEFNVICIVPVESKNNPVPLTIL